MFILHSLAYSQKARPTAVARLSEYWVHEEPLQISEETCLLTSFQEVCSDIDVVTYSSNATYRSFRRTDLGS